VPWQPHTPDEQVSFAAVQSRQVEASAPHCVFVGVATQVVASAQQPPQKRPLQTQLPPTHSRPAPQAALLPQLHTPLEQLSALPAAHATQALPSVAQPTAGLGVLQVCGVLLPLQQPMPLHVVAQAAMPPAMSLPLAMSTPLPPPLAMSTPLMPPLAMSTPLLPPLPPLAMSRPPLPPLPPVPPLPPPPWPPTPARSSPPPFAQALPLHARSLPLATVDEDSHPAASVETQTRNSSFLVTSPPWPTHAQACPLSSYHFERRRGYDPRR
jgi:homeobox protein ESX1